MTKTRVLAVSALVVLTSTRLFAADLRLGIVGTDTSHVIGFATAFNDPSSAGYVPGARIVAAFKGGSSDIPASRDRIDGFTQQLQQKYGVEIVDTIAHALVPANSASLPLFAAAASSS